MPADTLQPDYSTNNNKHNHENHYYNTRNSSQHNNNGFLSKERTTDQVKAHKTQAILSVLSFLMKFDELLKNQTK